MACPFFIPTEKMDNSSHPHPARLPLGAPWKGKCSAAQHMPSDLDLRDHCNLGYPKCNHLPPERHADAVRFVVAASSDSKVTLRYACELNYRPADCGTLEFDRHQNTWAKQHSDPRLQRMAECYLEAFFSRRA